MITKENLIEEKELLQKDFEELGKNIRKVEIDLGQLKANLNAINGAIQEVNKLMGRFDKKEPGKEK
jgi:predicted nuclease with TOPRIM domain